MIKLFQINFGINVISATNTHCVGYQLSLFRQVFNAMSIGGKKTGWKIRVIVSKLVGNKGLVQRSQ